MLYVELMILGKNGEETEAIFFINNITALIQEEGFTSIETLKAIYRTKETVKEIRKEIDAIKSMAIRED